MKNLIFFVVVLTLVSKLSSAENFVLGEFYESTVKNVFNTGHAVSLPPGKWEATDVEVDGEWAYIDFQNSIDNANFYVSMPSSQISGDYWTGSGIKPCKSKNEEGDKYKVHASGVKREKVQVTYCIQDVEWSGGNKDLNITLEAETTSAPLTWMKYSVYYDLKNSNVSSLSKNELKKIGNSLIKVLKNNIYGKPGDYTMATQLLNFTSTSEITSNVTKSLTDSYITKSTPEESDVKVKLKKLKAMLDEGLISQEQYDTKSTKLLEDF